MKIQIRGLLCGTAVLFLVGGCTNSEPLDRTNPESVAVAYETRKAQNDIKGAVNLLSPAMLELGAMIGGPDNAERVLRMDYEALCKHGGLRSIVILENRLLNANERLIRYRMTANDGKVVDAQQHMSLIDGNWYSGPAKSQL